jgi:hypothetical protein
MATGSVLRVFLKENGGLVEVLVDFENEKSVEK